VPFALAILRYALILDAGKGGAPEDVVLGDRPLQILFAIWLIVYAVGVYAHG
jgi:decaprenyl-phosphate phosphoribosyltransferase